ncbi:MAG: AmmeMemoRadiSam system protein B [Thermotogae bacterium]|nr:AmmeMemoRadiSam system protein B [Thermotogota bacterium]
MAMIREPAVSGTFYPESPQRLREMILRFLEMAQVDSEIPPKAVVAPHAGYIYSGPFAAYSFKTLLPLAGTNPTVFLLGPAHFVAFNGVSTGPFTYWRTPLGMVEVATERVEELLNFGYPFTDVADPLLPEHSLEVELPFLQVVLGEFRLVPLAFGIVNPLLVARYLLEVLGEKDIVVVSTDLSHYHRDDVARRIDEETLMIALKNDAEALLEREACGRYAWATLAAIAKELNWKPTLLIYGTSADTFGDPDSVVGYAALRYDDVF